MCQRDWERTKTTNQNSGLKVARCIQFAQTALNGNFPGRHRTDEYVIAGFSNGTPRLNGELRRIIQPPQNNMRVQE